MSLLRRFAVSIATTTIAAGFLLLPGLPAQASGVGYVRLAHLVPDKIECDMYIHLNSVTGNVLQTLPAVRYGTVSAYKSLPAGTYSVSMRKPGAPPDSQPVLSTSVTVVEGKGYTVARIGSPDKSEARVIEDDRTPPAADKGKVRVVQAAQRTLDVSVEGGPAIASGAAFATASGYKEVDAGGRTFSVTPSGGQAVKLQQQVASGSVYSILVTEDTNGGVKATILTDARRDGSVPGGGVATGAGGAAGGAMTFSLLVLSTVLLAGAGLLLVRRRT